MTTFQTDRAHTCCTLEENLQRVLYVTLQTVDDVNKNLIGVAWMCNKCTFINTETIQYLTNKEVLLNLNDFEYPELLTKELLRVVAAAKISKIVFNNGEPTDLMKTVIGKLSLSIILKNDYTPISTPNNEGDSQ